MTEKSAKKSLLVAATLLTVSTFPAPARAQALFTAPRDFEVGSNPFSVARGDLSGDGKADLVTANYGSNSVSVALARAHAATGPARAASSRRT